MVWKSTTGIGGTSETWLVCWLCRSPFIVAAPVFVANLSMSNSQEDDSEQDAKTSTGPASSHDQQLKKAACIGTSLMVVNAHRALALL